MKKTILLLLAVGLLTISTVACGGTGVVADAGGAAAQPEDNGVIEDLDEAPDENGDINIILPGEGEEGNMDRNIAEYFSVSGTIDSIDEVNGFTHVKIEDTDGNPSILVLSEDTVYLFSEELIVGETVTGWYLTNAPMIAIWPTQYTIAVLAAGTPDGVNIRVDRFFAWEDHTEGFLLSQDGMFAFQTDDNTEIVLADGQDFSDGEIEGRRIAVIYGISTRSIPEQATADKLVVLFESIVPLG